MNIKKALKVILWIIIITVFVFLASMIRNICIIVKLDNSVTELNNSKENIKMLKKVFIFEGEKSCLLYQSYFGVDNDLSVAVCGSSLINYQIDLLLSLGVEEVIIAFDKQFKEVGDEEWKAWTKKLKDIHKKYGSKVQITYMFDKNNYLGYKDSPIDCGKEIFLKMFEERVAL